MPIMTSLGNLGRKLTNSIDSHCTAVMQMHAYEGIYLMVASTEQGMRPWFPIIKLQKCHKKGHKITISIYVELSNTMQVTEILPERRPLSRPGTERGPLAGPRAEGRPLASPRAERGPLAQVRLLQREAAVVIVPRLKIVVGIALL